MEYSMNNNVSFIYFDIGGVLLKDYSCTNKWEEMKLGLGINRENSEEFEKIWEHYAEKRACLDYDVDKLIPVLRDELDLDLPKDYSLLQDFVNRFERNNGIWPIVRQAKKSYKIGLLTNMYPRMLGSIKTNKLLDDIDWNVAVDSSQVMRKKPDKDLFAFAQEAAKTVGKQILFIDNSKSHLAAAEEFGWQTYHFDSCDYQKSNQDLATFLSK